MSMNGKHSPPECADGGTLALVVRLIVCLLLFLATQFNPAAVIQAQAQTTTVTCTGASNPANVSQVNVDLAAQTCTITDGISAAAPSIGSMRFITRPDQAPDGVFAQVRNATGDNFALTWFTQCDMPGGITLAGGCRHEGNPVVGGTGTYANNLGTTLVTLTVTYTAVLNAITIVNASVTFGTPEASGPSAEDKSNLVAALQSSFTSATPGLLESVMLPSGPGQGLSVRPAGVGFAPSGKEDGPLDRGALAAYTAKRSGRGKGGFDFSADLNGLLNANHASVSEALAYGAGAAQNGDALPRANAWVQGRYVDFEDGATGADRGGHLWAVTSGLSYAVDANTTIGVITRYRSGRATSTAQSSSLDMEGIGGGAFVSTTIGGGVRFQGAGLYEWAHNEASIAGDSGGFDSGQLTLEGRIDKRFTHNGLWVEPGADLLYVRTKQDDYTDSAGVLVSNKNLTLGRLTYGPKIGTTVTHNETRISPFAKIEGIWDFETDGPFTTSSGAVFSSATTGLNLGGGIEVAPAGGLALTLGSDWTGYNTDLEAWSLYGGLKMSLKALGLGDAGTLALNFTGADTSATGKAEVKIPLGGKSE